LKINVLAVEYPGYGVYKKIKGKTGNSAITPSCKQIEEDAECVYDFLLANIKNIQEKDIILLGRSMGSGACFHLWNERNPQLMLLISPFSSIKRVFSDKLFFLGNFIPDIYFDNLKKKTHKTKDKKILLIHGCKDLMIKSSHSK
tara:strand:+ start:389 stop:820 length:432 start_codon:yes stop_codon:yes gene_type:complete